MALNDTKIRAFQAKTKPYKVGDDKGLYLEISPSDGKLWRLKYRVAGIEKKLALGRYPTVTLKRARMMRDEALENLSRGHDPAVEKQRAKATKKLSLQNTFGAIALEYVDKLKGEDKAVATIAKAHWFITQLRTLANRPITEIKPQDLLVILRRLETQGKRETAKRTRSFASRVFRYGVATRRCENDPAHLLSGALTAPAVKHHAAILDPIKFGELLRAIQRFDGHRVTRLALQLAPHVFVRPGELRHADWGEIDLEAATWKIPAGRMKARRIHAVPLSKQAVAILKQLYKITGPRGFIFPALYTSLRPMSENTINVSFRRMGFGADEVTAHGLRTTASTFLNESGKWHPDAIERALAHGDSDAVRGIYNRGQYWEERIKMMQWWSDRIDAMRDGGEVLAFDRKSKSK